MALLAGQGLWLSRFSTDGQLQGTQWPLPISGVVNAVASGKVTFASTTASVYVGAQGASNVLTVGSNSLSIQGSLQVTGVISASNSTNLQVQNPLLLLGASSSSTSLDGAGIQLGSAAMQSVSWRVATAVAPTAWELQGGGLRVTEAAPIGAPAVLLSYGLQTDSNCELQFYRRWTTTASECILPVVVYGGAASPFSLPTSSNVFLIGQ